MVKKKEPRKRYSFRFSKRELEMLDSLRIASHGESRTHTLRRLIYTAAEKQAK